MGEWSDYFEDFPEENPTNYVGSRFDPRAAEALRLAEAKRVAEQQALNAEIEHIVQRHRKSGSQGRGKE